MKKALKDVRFSHVVATALLSVLTVVTLVTIGSIYFLSKLAVEEDIQLLKKKSDAIAQLLLSSRQMSLNNALDSAVQSNALQDALRAQDVDSLGDVLTSILYTKQQGHLDFLYIHDGEDGFRLEISDNAISPGFLQALTDAAPLAEYSNRAFARRDDGTTVVAISSNRDIISPDTGKVLGELTGGFFVNRNTDLLRAFNELSGAEKSAFLIGSEVLAATPGNEWALDIQAGDGGEETYFTVDDRLIFDTRLESAGADAEDLSLRSEQSINVVEELTASFLKVVAIVVVAIIVTTLIATRVILNLSTRALDALTGYSQDILSGAKIEPFEGSHVREFNVVGNTLGHVAAALKESEGRFRDFADCGADWFWETDRNAVFTFMDGKTVEIIGLLPEEMLGRSRKEIRATLGQESVPELSKLDLVMEERGPVANFEARWRHPDGRIRYVLLNARPVLDENGEFQGYRGVGRDISARKAAIHEAVKARESAEEANKAKSHFLASMSHELRTPLNAIIGFTELLLLDTAKTLQDAQKGYLNNILTGGKQLLGLVDQVLDLAAVEDQRIEVHKEDISAFDIVEECVSMVSELAAQQGIALTNLSRRADMPPVHTDPVRLRQILLNLLNNAIKFNSENGSVTVEPSLRPDGYLRIAVADTGIGIPEEERETIFRLFGSLHQDAFTTTESYGIGLAVSKQLATALDGDLDFRSELGKGSTFWIDIPCAERQESAA